MESNDEKLFNRIEQSKINEAKEIAKKANLIKAFKKSLDAAKKGALASLPDSLVDKLGQGSPDMFFSAALTQTAAKAACASGKAEV